MQDETTLDVQGDEPTHEDVGTAAEHPSSPSSSEDVGQVTARFRAAGLDLSQLDPDTVSRAMALSQRVGNANVYTDDDVPNLLYSALQRIANHPNGKEFLTQIPGMAQLLQQQKQQLDDEDVDPDTREIRALRQQIEQQQQMLQGLTGDRDAIYAERQAEALGNQLRSQLVEGINAVPGASNMGRFIQERFWSFVGLGRLKGQSLTPAGIRQFVAQTVKDFGGSVAQNAGKRTAGNSSVSRILAKKPEELTADDVIEGLGAFLPE